LAVSTFLKTAFPGWGQKNVIEAIATNFYSGNPSLF